jgi:hypothetical protein
LLGVNGREKNSTCRKIDNEYSSYSVSIHDVIWPARLGYSVAREMATCPALTAADVLSASERYCLRVDGMVFRCK